MINGSLVSASMIDLLLPSSKKKSYFVRNIRAVPNQRFSVKMKGLALTIAIGLTCIWTNTNGMQVNVNVDINTSDEPGNPGKVNSEEASLVTILSHSK